MQEFLHQNGQIPQNISQSFAMEQMRRDLDGFRVNSPTQSPAWAADFDVAEQARLEAAFRSPNHTLERQTLQRNGSPFTQPNFKDFQQQNLNNPTPMTYTRPFGTNGLQRPFGMASGMYGGGMMASHFGPNHSQRSQQEQAIEGKGKGKMVELDDKDWETQFAALEKNGLSNQDLDAEANKAVEEELDQMDRSVNRETLDLGDFESIWRGIEAETRENLNYRDLNGQNYYAQPDIHNGDEIPISSLDNWDGFDSHFHDAFRDPQLGNYLFEQDNPFNATKNPFEEGLRIVDEGGNLSLAALAFEAAVQQDPQHFQAWYQLGSAQAQNEKEAPAIRALEQCLKIDPDNLPALMGLAISYTNEGYDSTAYRTLERWLATKYPQIISPDDLTPENDYGYTERSTLHEKITDLFIRAAQLSPDGEHMDPDVQVGLGVLFYGAEEYTKAVDCFEAALASTEEGTTNGPSQAHLLWNRLGATLANSGRSEDAIGAYEKALTLNPNFVRARYNLGVSCINIGVYEQAVQHLLGALSMHNVVEREGIEKVREVIGEDRDVEEVERMVGMNQSTNLIETLRRVFGSMGRRDLAERVERGMDVEAFRGEFDF